jgi:hypothetical protein
MKKLVLGALVAAASLTGCIISSDSGDDVVVPVDTVVTMRWNFTHLADMSARSCPIGFGTATIVSQATDDVTHLGTGKQFIDKFNCSDGQGTITLPGNDTYLVWVQIENDTGTNLYAQSEETFVDTVASVPTIPVTIYDDGGFFYLEWDLVDARTNALLTCAQAGVTANGSVETIATSVASPSYFKDDKFTCQDHFGTTDPLLAGSYTVSIDAEENNRALGQAPTLTNKTIKAMNGLTDLGLIRIPIN